MKHSEIREELVREHETVRALVERVSGLAERVLGGDVAGVDALRSGLAEVDRLVRQHNARETELLEPVLGDLDAWGPERTSQMGVRHSDEHASLAAALEAASREPEPHAVAEHAKRALASLLEHMEHEERELLSAKLLRDDAIQVEFGG